MFVGKPPGNYDRLLDFSRAVTGTLFFVPVGDVSGECRDGDAAGIAAARLRGQVETEDQAQAARLFARRFARHWFTEKRGWI